MKFLIVGGLGSVGQATHRQLQLRGCQTESFTSKDPRDTFKKRLAGIDGVFLAISNRKRGEIASQYILDALDEGVPVATAEKGALAYHFEQLRPFIDRIGFSPTVGGGSGMLELLRHPHLPLIRLTGVINGTCNFLFAEDGDPLDILRRAHALGLPEPGAAGLAETVNAEIKDIILKLCILFNLSGVYDECLVPDDLSEVLFAEEEILRLLLAKKYRLVVSISPHVPRREPLGIHGKKGSWSIWAEFVDIGSVDFQLPNGTDNVLVCTDCSGDTMMARGPGAGPDVTAAALIADMLRLVEKRRV